MLTYTFSRREKFLLLILAIVLVAIAWFVFVFQRSSDEVIRLDGEIATTQAQITAASTRVDKMHNMQAVIDKYKGAGIEPSVIPAFDNMTNLMSELNRIMAAADAYVMTFDVLDAESSADYVLRGVRIDYSCGTSAQAEAIVRALSNGKYPCSIDSLAIVDSSTGSSGVSASVHVTFYEKVSSAASGTTGGSASSAASASAA